MTPRPLPPPCPRHPAPLYASSATQPRATPVVVKPVTAEEKHAVEKWARRKAWWLFLHKLLPSRVLSPVEAWLREQEAKIHIRRLPPPPSAQSLVPHQTPPVLPPDACEEIRTEALHTTDGLQPGPGGDRALPLSHLSAGSHAWEQAHATEVLLQSVASHYSMPIEHLHLPMGKLMIVSSSRVMARPPSFHRTPIALCFAIPLDTDASLPSWLLFQQEPPPLPHQGGVKGGEVQEAMHGEAERYPFLQQGAAFVFPGGRLSAHIHPPGTKAQVILQGVIDVGSHLDSQARGGEGDGAFIPRWYTSSGHVSDQDMASRLWRWHDGGGAVVRSLPDLRDQGEAEVVRYRVVREGRWQRLLRRIRGKEVVEWHFYDSSSVRGSKTLEVGRLGFRLVRAERPALRSTVRSLLRSNVSPKVALLIYIFVEPAYRGRGLGEAMLEELKKSLAQEGFNILMLSVDDNGSGGLVKYYQRLGYTVVPDLSRTGTPIMVKSLLN